MSSQRRVAYRPAPALFAWPQFASTLSYVNNKRLCLTEKATVCRLQKI